MDLQHLLVIFVWCVLTGFVNWAMRKNTAAEWEALAETSPRYAAFARMLRAIGVDPVKLISALADFVKGKAKTVDKADDSSEEETKK